MTGITGILSGIDNPEAEMDVLRDVGGASAGLPEWVERAVVAAGQYGIPAALVAVVLVAWWVTRRRGAEASAAVAHVAWAGCAAGAAYLLNLPIRDFVARPRPVDHPDLAGLEPLVDGVGGYSFVSAHAATAMAVTVALLLVHRGLGVTALVLTLAQGVAQVVMGVHYPTDVVGGFALGAAAALLLAPLGQAVLTPLARWCGRTRGLRWIAPAGPNAQAGQAGPAGGGDARRADDPERAEETEETEGAEEPTAAGKPAGSRDPGGPDTDSPADTPARGLVV